MKQFEQCDEIWHAGDIGSWEVAENLAAFRPLRAVHGNIDGGDVRRHYPAMDRFTIEGTEVRLKHIGGYPGKYDVSIRELAENQSCLFVGRCADYILRDHPRHINIFISASKEARIERLMQLNNITAEQAEEMMEKADKKRASYYNYYSYKTWGAAATYHLCVDSSVMGIDKTVEYILQFVKHKLNLP